MHLNTILAFAFVFWQAQQPLGRLLVGERDVGWTLLFVLAQPPLLWAAAALTARRGCRLLGRYGEASQLAQHAHHRATFVMRTVALGGFGVAVFLTRWPLWFTFGSLTPPLQIVGDIIVLLPFVLNHLAIWIGAYPFERMLRRRSLSWLDDADGANGADGANARGRRGLRTYLDFNLRHHVLVVAVPMTLVLFAADLTRGYEVPLRRWSGWVWAPDAILGMAVAVVFVLSPLILCRIWRTRSLESGLLRRRLEALCDRIGLKCRDILVWYSDGAMINAAVMGLFSPVRYVLLSDALLDSMSEAQIEAVFGHEAGHVRRRHIQHLLILALVGWLLVAGMMEVLTRTSNGVDSGAILTPVTIQGLGVVATVVFWGLGFGWVSRRFEREADLFGATCVTPDPGTCKLPCSVHPNPGVERTGNGRVCATGAAIFTSALDRVAVLNGIPHEERSWRHSSIGSRIRFLTSLAGDPNRARRFGRTLRRIKLMMLAAAVIGSAVSLYYVTNGEQQNHRRSGGVRANQTGSRAAGPNAG